MGSTNEQFSKIRKVMDKMRIEKYAINNPQLAVLDEYTKTLYLKVLCTVIQYKNNPSEMQTLYLKRIIKGMDVDKTLEDYMKKGMEISETDIQEFIWCMKENIIRYHFGLQGLLLLSMRELEDTINYEYFAELIELCDITKNELKCLTYIAKSVIEQDSSYFEKAKDTMSENMERVLWFPYIENYYIGATQDTKLEKYYTAPDINLLQEIKLPFEYVGEKITFRNIVINVKDMFRFKGCKEIIFENCKLIGNEFTLQFDGVGSIQFEKCSFSKFHNRVGVVRNSNEVIIRNCKFDECGYITEYGDKRGGVFAIMDDNAYKNDDTVVEKIVLENNDVHNCYIKVEKRRYNFGVTGAFIGFPNGKIKQLTIKNNMFSGCRCINNGNYYESIFGVFHAENLVNENNHATGELKKLFEKND